LSKKRNFDCSERYLQKSENIMMDRSEWYSMKAENRKIEGHPKINVDHVFPRGSEQKYRVSLKKKYGGILPGIGRCTVQY
jgi:hypothetical protein